ncbi:MAG TPA: hypothetical protein ENJ90_04430 [Devosia sp.]|nr:hypothetical protein [Devosia sp.]
MSAGKGVQVYRPAHSAVFLADKARLRRRPRAPGRKRPLSFYEQFEDKALFYDCFWHHGGADILLVGPPPLNLAEHYKQARFVAKPSGVELKAEFFPSRSTMTTRLADAPTDTTHVEMNFSGELYRFAVQPSLVEKFAGARILFSMNKNNELRWISDWVAYHVRHHHADSVVLFDNGSNLYGHEELEQAVTRIEGLKRLVLFSWPYRFGRTDSRVFTYHYWAHFLQISSMGLVLRRLGMRAEAILNCDVDELVAPVAGSDIFKLTQTASYGVASLSGKWVEAVIAPDRSGYAHAQGFRHGDFSYMRRDPSRFLCPKKWALNPRNDWVENLNIFPYWHRIMGAPERRSTEKPVCSFWHFRGISTNWKQTRRQPDKPSSLLHYRDEKLFRAVKNISRTGRGTL